jgi:hypothetical protein
MDDLNILGALGLTFPTPAYLIGAILFGIIGIAAYRDGKKTSRRYPKWIGVGLMLYPYAASQTCFTDLDAVRRWRRFVRGAVLPF